MSSQRVKTLSAAIAAVVSVAGFTATYAHTHPTYPRPTQDTPTVVFVTSADMPCGPDAWGCYSRTTPDVIYIADNNHRYANADAADIDPHSATAYVIAHETAHFNAFKNGEPSDECAADAYAYAVTGNAVMYTSTSYAIECGHV